MPLLDDYNAAVENPQFRQRVAISVTRTVMNVMAGSPTAPQQALAKRFMLAPSAEVDRYTLPVAARLFINGVTVIADANDTQIQTAVNEVLAVNVALGIT